MAQNRRSFLKGSGAFGAAVTTAWGPMPAQAAKSPTVGDPHPDASSGFASLIGRLGAATPRAILAPIMRGAVVAGAPAGARLHRDLAEPSVFEIAGGQRFQQMAAARLLAGAALNIVRANPPAIDVAVNLFPREISRGLEEYQGAFLGTCFLAVMVLAAVGVPIERALPDVVRTAASATPAGQLLRGMFADPLRQPPPIDPPKGGFPGLPGISEKLLVKAEELQRAGCINAVMRAVAKWGVAVAAVTPKYLPIIIKTLSPQDACPGEEMTIVGSGMGDGTRSAVAFTRADGGIATVQSVNAREWTDVRVRVVVPTGAVRGPIGILKFPVSPASSTPSIGSAATKAIAEIATCFGPGVTDRLSKTIQNLLAPPVSTPDAQADRANLYVGGPPVVRYFWVDPLGKLWPRKRIRLVWEVEGADRIEIVARDVVGSPAQELPPISGPLAPTTGSVSVEVPGTHAWQGQYVLRSFNRCTGAAAIELGINLEMVIRRGLALSGGGARGDFQAGALLYLYDSKSYRPDAITATSVGAINAIELVMGDNPPPGPSAAARLVSIWQGLVDETRMWGEELWLSQKKQEVRSFIRTLPQIGLNLLPFSALIQSKLVEDFAKDIFERARELGYVALFNLAPIEAMARSRFNPQAVTRSGIRLRLISVSLETGELVMVNETGGVLQSPPQPIRPASVGPATAAGIIEGMLASASMPGIFPAVRLADHMCVDGGVKDIVPVDVALRDLGCHDIIAIRASARSPLLPTDPARAFYEVMARSVLELTYDEIGDNDVAPPFSGWAPEVTVRVIQPSFDLHDTMVVEPELIQIAIDYGWMRAADVLDVPEGDRREYARNLSDQITRLRWENWYHAHFAAGLRYEDPSRGFFAFLLAGIEVPEDTGIQPVPTPEAVDVIRENCWKIRKALEDRLSIPAPTPPPNVRNAWFTQWELRAATQVSNDPWALFVSPAGIRPADTPPTPV